MPVRSGIITAFLVCAVSTGLTIQSGCAVFSTSRPLTMKHDGMNRSYVLHVPPSYSGTDPVPLVVVLHGALLKGGDMQRGTHFDAVADRENFIVCYPNSRRIIWNGNYIGEKSKRLPDDVAFLNALVDKLSAEYAIDQRRIYIAGMSNGGMMAYRMACDAGGRYAGVAVVIATFPVGYDDYCKPSDPIPMLIMAGTEDPIFRWEGGPDMFGDLSYLTVQQTVDFWVKANVARPEPAEQVVDDRDPEDGTRVTRTTYPAAEDGAPVVLYRIDGGGHAWPIGTAHLPEPLAGIGNTCRDIGAAEAIWAFFSGL